FDEPHAAYEHPVSAFASNFLGKTNTLSGRVTQQRVGTCTVALQGLDVQVACDGHTLASEVDVYIRPEKIHFGPSDTARLSGRVVTRLFLGERWVLEVDTPLGIIRVTVPNVGEQVAQEGMVVGLNWADA